MWDQFFSIHLVTMVSFKRCETKFTQVVIFKGATRVVTLSANQMYWLGTSLFWLASLLPRGPFQTWSGHRKFGSICRSFRQISPKPDCTSANLCVDRLTTGDPVSWSLITTLASRLNSQSGPCELCCPVWTLTDNTSVASLPTPCPCMTGNAGGCPHRSSSYPLGCLTKIYIFKTISVSSTRTL